jgi:hypothetical protein
MKKTKEGSVCSMHGLDEEIMQYFSQKPEGEIQHGYLGIYRRIMLKSLSSIVYG